MTNAVVETLPKTSWHPLSHAAVLGLTHAVVDAATVTALYRTTRVVDMTRMDAFILVVSYTVIAFGLQPVVGLVADRFQWSRTMLVLGFLLPMVALGTHSQAPVWTLVLSGLGNAMFHVGAGVQILELGLNKTAPAGVFVGPGAIGLAFGMWYGRAPDAGPVWPIAMLLVFALLLALLPAPQPRRQPHTVEGATPNESESGKFATGANESPSGAGGSASAKGSSTTGTGELERSRETDGSWRLWTQRVAASAKTTRWLVAAILLLSISVAVRALVGTAASRGCPKMMLLLLGIPAAACFGKALGGFVADRIGWLESTSAALLVSAPLLVWGVEQPILLIVGLLIFQTTMPVTLIGIARALPKYPGTAFGLPCLALAIGMLPTTYHGTEPLLARPLLFGWIGLALVSVVGGLWLLGIRPKAFADQKHGKRVVA